MPPVHYHILMGIAATLALISELYQLQEEQNMWVDLSTATLTGGEADNGMVGDNPPHTAKPTPIPAGKHLPRRAPFMSSSRAALGTAVPFSVVLKEGNAHKTNACPGRSAGPAHKKRNHLITKQQ